MADIPENWTTWHSTSDEESILGSADHYRRDCPGSLAIEEDELAEGPGENRVLCPDCQEVEDHEDSCIKLDQD